MDFSACLNSTYLPEVRAHYYNAILNLTRQPIKLDHEEIVKHVVVCLNQSIETLQATKSDPRAIEINKQAMGEAVLLYRDPLLNQKTRSIWETFFCRMEPFYMLTERLTHGSIENFLKLFLPFVEEGSLSYDQQVFLIDGLWEKFVNAEKSNEWVLKDFKHLDSLSYGMLEKILQKILSQLPKSLVNKHIYSLLQFSTRIVKNIDLVRDLLRQLEHLTPIKRQKMNPLLRHAFDYEFLHGEGEEWAFYALQQDLLPELRDYLVEYFQTLVTLQLRGFSFTYSDKSEETQNDKNIALQELAEKIAYFNLKEANETLLPIIREEFTTTSQWCDLLDRVYVPLAYVKSGMELEPFQRMMQEARHFIMNTKVEKPADIKDIYLLAHHLDILWDALREQKQFSPDKEFRQQYAEMRVHYLPNLLNRNLPAEQMQEFFDAIFDMDAISAQLQIFCPTGLFYIECFLKLLAEYPQLNFKKSHGTFVKILEGICDLFASLKTHDKKLKKEELDQIARYLLFFLQELSTNQQSAIKSPLRSCLKGKNPKVEPKKVSFSSQLVENRFYIKENILPKAINAWLEHALENDDPVIQAHLKEIAQVLVKAYPTEVDYIKWAGVIEKNDPDLSTALKKLAIDPLGQIEKSS